MEFKKIALLELQLFGSEKLLLTKVFPVMKFVDGHYTQDVDHFNIEGVAVDDKSYNKFIVKVAEKPSFTQEQIDNATSPLYVTFKGFEGRIYMNYKTGKPDVTCKAQSAQLVNVKA
jgi:hypothetical protein